MIKIEKDVSQIPSSLQSKETNELRNEIIDNKKFIKTDKFEKAYKSDDIKKALKAIYHSKCAYCEQKVEELHVEHYRPKSIYWWLAYSWDNLLLACPVCNRNKSNHFEMEGLKVVFHSSELPDIHNLGLKYDHQENPKFINPETENVENDLVFKKDGSVSSPKNHRLQHTIDRCKLDRTYLNDERRKVLEDLIKDYKAELRFSNKEKADVILRSFEQKSKDNSQPFSAYNRFVVKILYLAKQLNTYTK